MRLTLVGADLEENLVRGQDGVAIAELRLCQVAGRRKT